MSKKAKGSKRDSQNWLRSPVPERGELLNLGTVISITNDSAESLTTGRMIPS